MGVTGLWKLIEPCGTPVPIETLEGKILAVDISIWLHQVVKGFQDSNGSALAHAHLLGLFHRLCKLMYYRVKPVFVFDGCVPQLKRDTIAKRQQQRSKLNTEADRIQNLLLEQLAKEQVVQKALGNAANELAPLKRLTAKPSAKEDDEMFKLPELPTTSHNSSFMSSQDESSIMETSLDSSDDEENCARRYYTNNLQAIDVHAKDFRSLPADMRYDILVDIKETRKQNSWGRLHELPAESGDFSSFQMKRLLKRRAVQESLQEAEKEMGGRTLTYSELQTYFKEEGVLEETAFEEASRQIACDENTRYLLVQDLKKQLAEKKEHQKLVTITEDKEDVKHAAEKKENEISIETSADYEADLQLAISLSLEDREGPNLYKEEDYILDQMKLRMNKIQREKFKNVVKGPAKTYMVEYAGMNHDEVKEIVENTPTSSPKIVKENAQTLQLSSESENEVEEIVKTSTSCSIKIVKDLQLSSGSEGKWKENVEIPPKMVEKAAQIVDISSESENDEDFVEVTLPEKAPEENQPNKLLEVFINLNEPMAADDIFADVFSVPAKQDTSMNSDSDTDLVEAATLLENSQKSVQSPIKETAKDLEKKVTSLQQKNAQSEEVAAQQIKEAAVANILVELKQKLDEVQNYNLKSIEIEIQTGNGEVDKNTLKIFEEMRKQMENVGKIDLNKVEIRNEIINVDNDEVAAPSEVKIKQEVIDIKTPTGTPKKSNSKSVTPSRITDFFNTEYVVNKTPESIKKEETEDVVKVKSPFYRRKTPKSKTPKSDKAKTSENEATVERKTPSKAVRELFPRAEKVSTTEDILGDVAADLKQQKTREELRAMATDLAEERKNLESERNRQDRMGMSISQRMNAECQELLRLFGVPYIVAPMEAEAQCAFLDAVQLTHGTITDDSDIWLFGGRTVYKNFFVQNKHVLKFSADEIKTQFKCDRHTLVQLACLVGSDYTTGVHGIGAVTALEILSSFTRDGNKNEENMRQRIKLIMDTLQRFRDWWQTHKLSAAPPGSTARQTLLKKLKNIELHEGFPSAAVIEAYLLPKVDESRSTFSWGQPDVESLREFARKTFGWTTTKTDEILKPVLKRLADKQMQKTMRNYFLTSNAVKSRELKVSKRVQGAIQRLALGGEDAAEVEVANKVATTEAVPAKKQKKQQFKRKAVKSKKNLLEGSLAEAFEAPFEECDQQPSTSTEAPAITKGTRKSSRKVAITTKEIIPQRERDLEQMRQKKELAAVLFKAAAINNKKK